MSLPNFRSRKLFVVLVTLSLVILLASAAVIYAQGGAITYGATATGTISAEAPLAFYTFSGNEGDLIAATVIGITPGVEPSISLLSPSQEQLTTSGENTLLSGAGQASLSYRLPTTGAYVLLVSSVAPGDFLLRLDGEASPPPADLAPDAPTTATIPTGGGAQVFNVPGNPTEPVAVTFGSADPGFEFTVEVRNPQGRLVAVLSGDGVFGATLTLAPSDGVYEIRIVPTTPETTGSVTINLGDAPAAPSSAPTSAAPQSATATPIPATSAPGEACTITGSNVNLREGPSVDFDIVGYLNPGIALPVIGQNGTGWYQVNYNGVPAWVFGDVVTFTGNCLNIPFAAAPSGPSTTGTTQAPSASPTLATVTASPTTTGPTATASPTLVGPTATASPTTQNQPTATYTPSYTPTTPPVQPTATYTPSYTPTTPPAAQIAPEDSRSNPPLVVELDNTASVLDFVSYPGGDREDRVVYDVTGMNPNVAFSGGRARMVISASCFGEGTQYIEFFTGGQTYSCGQTLVDREVTYDSDTGSVTITAVGGDATYVQWVLTGTVTRIN